MEYKYLKLPIVTVSNFEEDEILSKISSTGSYLVTNGKTTQLFYIYTREEVDGTISKWTNIGMAVSDDKIYDEPPSPSPTSQVGSDTTIVPKGSYVSEKSLIEIIKRITK